MCDICLVGQTNVYTKLDNIATKQTPKTQFKMLGS